MLTLSKSSRCPCGSTLKFSKCCGQYIKQANNPLTPEALMRSRYTAYVLCNEQYLLNSWHPSTRPSELNFKKGTTDWFKLEVLATHAGKSRDDSGTVEFIAYFKAQNQRQTLHEVSRFIKEEGRWYYLNAELSPRN